MKLPFAWNVEKEAHAQLILNSYRRWMGKPLIEIQPEQSVMEQLFLTPKFVLSHGTEEDPILNFGSKAALGLWEMNWEEFVRMPSNLTAEPVERSVRDQFLKAVNENGYVDNYTGIRISNTGRKFWIKNAVVWNLVDDKGVYRGQAAAFDAFEHCEADSSC